MRSDRRSRQEVLEKGFAILAGSLLAAYFALNVFPQVFGGFVGAIVAAAHPWRFDEPEDRRHWSALAGWSIAAGVVLVGAYVLVASPIGADAELRRFGRQWAPDEGWFSTLLDHPWAWLPLAVAAAMLAYGGGMLWRASR